MGETVLDNAASQGDKQQIEQPVVKQEAGAPDWKQQIPESIRGEKTWEKHKDIGSALQSLHHLEKKLGSAVNIPGENATPEEIASYREKIGVPKEANGYKYDTVKLPGEHKWDEGGMGEFSGVAHKLGLTPDQHKGLLEYYGASLGYVHEANAKAYSDGEAALKTEWGSQFDENLALAGIGLKSYDESGAFKASLVEAGVANHPAVLKFLHGVGAEVGEDRVANGEKKDIMTKEEAERAIRAIEIDAKHALHNKKDPAHSDAVKQYGELLKLSV